MNSDIWVMFWIAVGIAAVAVFLLLAVVDGLKRIAAAIERLADSRSPCDTGTDGDE